MARVANPYSENEDSDNEDQAYTVVRPSTGREKPAASEVDTLVPGAVQHVCRTGYPSNKGVKKSLDIYEKPNRQPNRLPTPCTIMQIALWASTHVFFFIYFIIT